MEETKTTEVITEEETKAENKVEPKVESKETKAETKEEEKKPTIDELMVEVAKLRRQADKNASEAKEWKDKYRSTLSEKEVMDAEKAEAMAQRDAEFESMKKTLQINELTENFMDLGYSKELAKKAATSQVEGDTSALLAYQKQFQDQQQKKWEADFLKSRPEINVGGGTGTSYTKEQFDNMSLIERTKLKRENEAEYKRLLAL